MRKNLWRILFVSAASAILAFGFSACEKSYTTTETDALIAELQEAILDSKTELDKKIATLTAEYKAKDNELLAKITANEQALADLKTAYESKVAELTKADEDNAKAIAELEAEYLAKVEELVKADGENAKKLAELKTAYESKVTELTKADEDNAKAIAKLEAEYLAKVEELVKADEDNAKAIAELETEYLAKVEELVKADGENAKKLAELKTAYESKVAELTKADEDNAKAIAKLEAEYLAKVDELEDKIATANDTIENNKTELNGAILALTATYQTKMAEIDGLLTLLKNTNSTQDEKIAELVGKITALENATRITNIVFAENGDLVITFGDGSTQTMKAPEKHIHSFGEWISTTKDESVSCDERLFVRICTECSAVEGRLGSEEDHDWAIKYSYNDEYHWRDCNTCDGIHKEEHTIESSGVCSVCDGLVGATEGILYEVIDGEARVLGYEGTFSRVRIAETYNGVPVTSIGDSAFEYCSSLTSVTIGNGVTSIGKWAFENCDSLTSVIIPDSVTSIGYRAFYNCRSLTSVTIGDDVTSIGSSAFYGCGRLTSVYITDITAWCNISFIDFGANPLYYAKNLYLNNELVTELVIPNTVTEIKAYAFHNCSSLTSVTIGNGVTSIGDDAFRNCSSLTNVYYKGTASEWGQISIGGGNSSLTSATCYYYSEIQPTTTGNYWHYVDGVATPWVYTKEE